MDKTELGERLYDHFLKKLDAAFGTNTSGAVSNPRTNTLELFAVLDERDMKRELLAAMCRELAGEIGGEELFVEKGELYQTVRRTSRV